MVLELCPACGKKAPPQAVVCPNDGEVLIPADRDPLLGQEVASYRITRRLGVGGMGAVYEGHDPTIEKRVAIKIVHATYNSDPRLSSLLAEARAVNAIGDEGIVDVYSFGTLPDGRSYLVMELLEGQLLEDQLQKGRTFSIVEAIDVVAPLLQALEAAHAAGFVHRDLKPANIFIVQRPNRAPFPKLLDFGIAARIKVGAADAVGTIGYLSPEQASNTNVGAKADLYAVGCILFELISGRMPFMSTDWNEVLRLHREAPRPSLQALKPEVSDELDQLVRQLMALEPTRRPPSAAAVRTTLLAIREALTRPPEAAVTTAPSAPRLEPVAEQTLPPASRAPLWLGLTAVGLLAVVVAVLLRPTAAAVPQPEPVREDPLAVAAKTAATEVEQKLAGPRPEALESLLAAEAAYPGRPEWKALRARLTTALRGDVQAALKKDEGDAAAAGLAALGKLGALQGDDPLEGEVQRLTFALHNGMAHVGDVFIDRYEYPNRAGTLPATEVDYDDAVKLCEGAGKRLCTELEWERACRGDTGSVFPWGVKLDRGQCVTKDKKVKGPLAAGAKATCVGPAGVFDLIGNVAEWTSSPFVEGKPQRVVRGGSFASGEAKLACDARDYVLPGVGGTKQLGFRCCR